MQLADRVHVKWWHILVVGCVLVSIYLNIPQGIWWAAQTSYQVKTITAAQEIINAGKPATTPKPTPMPPVETPH